MECFSTSAGQIITSGRPPPSVIVPAHRSFRVNALGKHDTIALRVEVNALNEMISALVGDDRNHNISFDGPFVQRKGQENYMKQAVLQFVADLDFMEAISSATVLDGLGQALILKFLFLNRHSLSEKLRKESPELSAKQGKRIEEFIESSWNRPLNIEAMVNELGISGRSIFRYFKGLRGETPLAFQKRIRLLKSRTMLQTSEPETSVE